MSSGRKELLSTLFPDIEAELTKCERPLVFKWLKRMAAEFCRDTQAWKCELDPIDILEDVEEYELDHAGDVDVDMCDWVKQGNIYLAPQSQYVLEGSCTLRLIRAPSADDPGGLLVKAVLKPKLDLCETDSVIDADVLTRWGDKIAEGVLAKLKGMSNRPWTDIPMSNFYRIQFAEAKMYARSKVEKENTNGSLTMRAPPSHEFR